MPGLASVQSHRLQSVNRPVWRQFAGKVEYAQLLNDASEVFMKGPEPWQIAAEGAPPTDTLTLTLPVLKPNVTVPVIELFLT